jgi:PAS domain S-box-containing protein
MNRVAEELTGWPLSEAGGRQFDEIFQVADQEGELDEKKLTLLALKSGKQYERSSGLTLLTRDGKELPAAVNVAPIRSGSGETLGAVLVFRDMTRENKLMDVVQRNGKLESLGIMAGGIAHDFNNLLGGLFGYVDLARSNIGRDREVKEYLDGAMEAYTRVRDLTQQLLTFSRGGEPSLRSGRLEEVIRKSVALSLSGSPCAADLRIAEDLPPALYDENQIGQVLDNLLINARQAMPEGGTVTVSAAGIAAAEGQIPGLNAGDYIKVSVRDTGPGIPDTITQHVFDPFFTTKESGSGLGLTTSYSIISRHNGMLDFTTRPGRGSEFVFYLPQAEREAEAADADEVSPEHRGSGVIVIMDDEMIIRDILGTMLRSMGYEVYGTSEGGEVLDLCRVLQQRGVVIRAIFLDLTVPAGMGGVKTAAELRRRQSEMPLFVSSGYSADPVMADPARFGFTASISKPYIQQDLSAFLNRYLP